MNYTNWTDSPVHRSQASHKHRELFMNIQEIFTLTIIVLAIYKNLKIDFNLFFDMLEIRVFELPPSDLQ